MKLKTVTFTGADNTTNPDRLAELSQEYPFVEWGFLLSMAKSGESPRYPSLPKLFDFSSVEGEKAVHLCGWLARKAAGNVAFSYPLQTALTLLPGVNRIQINVGRTIHDFPYAVQNLSEQAMRAGVATILQSYSFTIPEMEAAMTKDYPGVVFLHDNSGGKAIDGDFQKPVNNDYVGFAGGITPENVEGNIHQVYDLGGDNDFWIDIESGVRTNDQLDLDKVVRVLEIAKGYVGK